MKTILVVGGAGYIGSHAVKALIRTGHRPVVLDNLSRGHRDAVLTDDFVEGDLRDYDRLMEVFKSFNIDAVMHFAALTYVGESVEHPELYYDNNAVGGLTLLRAMRASGVKKFIFSSTAAVYGEPQAIPIPEDTTLSPINPYGTTKLFFERALSDYDAAYGMRYVSLRYFNAAGCDPEGEIGERHDPETHLIPLVLQAAGGVRESITVFGDDYPTPDGTCIRDYIHMTDLIDAHLLALSHLMKGGESDVFNLGSESGHSVMEVIEVCRRVTGREINVETGARRAGDPPVLVASSKKAKEKLGWHPSHTDLEEIVRDAWNFMVKRGMVT
jgi:UDP-glucose 4-epimerase